MLEQKMSEQSMLEQNLLEQKVRIFFAWPDNLIERSIEANDKSEVVNRPFFTIKR
jgi:hypothetical protein